MNKLWLRCFTAALVSVLSSSAGLAQQPVVTPVGPVPPALTNAKTIFVSNAGADSGLFPQPFSGDPDRPYSEFYAGLKAFGKFDLVADPSEADLVLELQLTAPNGPTKGSKVNGASDPVPMLRLVIYDRKTHYVLWAVTESIEIAYLQKTHDRNFDQAVTALLDDFKRVSGKMPTP
jgi:hypothetical protein